MKKYLVLNHGCIVSDKTLRNTYIPILEQLEKISQR